MKIIIDAGGGVLGRICSFAAKQTLLGKEVIVVNCNSAIISGSRNMIVHDYQQSRVRGGTALKGPHFPKNPERIMKRTIRNMIPYKKGKGTEALKRVMCYNEVPAEYEKSDKIKILKEIKVNSITLKELSKVI